jgi:hypothetical protein
MLYTMKKEGASEVVDKKNAVVELYDAIQRAVADIDGKAIEHQETDPSHGVRSLKPT